MSNTYVSDEFYIDVATFIVRTKQQFIAAATTLSLTGIQAMTLLLLDDKKRPTMSYLCKQFECDAGNITGIIDGLEEKGLVTRCPDTKDRRVKIIQLEPAGKAMQSAILDQLRLSGEQIFAGLDATDQQQLAGLLRKLAA